MKFVIFIIKDFTCTDFQDAQVAWDTKSEPAKCKQYLFSKTMKFYKSTSEAFPCSGLHKHIHDPAKQL